MWPWAVRYRFRARRHRVRTRARSTSPRPTTDGRPARAARVREAMRGKATVALVLFILVVETREAYCASVSGTAQVTVFRALSITANRTLPFGTLIRPAAGSGTAGNSSPGGGGAPVGGGSLSCP